MKWGEECLVMKGVGKERVVKEIREEILLQIMA
jgi:hypothetical protein